MFCDFQSSPDQSASSSQAFWWNQNSARRRQHQCMQYIAEIKDQHFITPSSLTWPFQRMPVDPKLHSSIWAQLTNWGIKKIHVLQDRSSKSHPCSQSQTIFSTKVAFWTQSVQLKFGGFSSLLELLHNLSSTRHVCPLPSFQNLKERVLEAHSQTLCHFLAVTHKRLPLLL